MNSNRRVYNNRKSSKNLKGGNVPASAPASAPAPVSKANSKGTLRLNTILTKLYNNNYQAYIAINKILNISINLVKSNKVIYRTLYTIILNTFEEAVKRIVKGDKQNLESKNIANSECTGKLNAVGNGSNSWDKSCYKKLLVNPSAVIDLLKDSMLFQLATINVDFDKIISSKGMYKNDIQLSNATKQIMNSIKEHEESNVAMQRLYDVVTRQSSKGELPDRNSLFEILIIFKEINNNYDDSRKLYKQIRKLKSNSTTTPTLSYESKSKIAENIKKWLNVYKQVYTKLTALIENSNTTNSSSSTNMENFLTIADNTKISVNELDNLQKKLRYIIGERMNSLKIEDKDPNKLTDIIKGEDSGTKSNVDGKMIKQLFILFYVFYLSITAQSLEVYTRGLKLLDIELSFTSNNSGAASGAASGTSGD